MKILIKDNFDDELKKIWEELENKSSITIFQKYQWNYHWYKYICNNDAKINLKIFLIFQNEDLIAILPFYIKKNFTHRSLEWVGGLYSDYKGPIFKNSIELSKEEFSYIWKKIIESSKGADLLRLEQQLIGRKNHYNPFTDFLPSTSINQSYGVKIDEKWENYYERKSSKTRQTIRRKIKKLEENGKLEFFKEEEINQKKKILEWTIHQKKKQFQITGAQDIFKKDNEKEFYIHLLDKHDYFHCSCIYQKGKIIASHVGINDNRNFLYLIPCYINNGSLKNFSPGQILQIFLLKWCFEKKMYYFDFTIGNEKYKIGWNNSIKKLASYYKPISFLGMIIYYKIRIKIFIKKILQNEK